jgi:hypothetical protein
LAEHGLVEDLFMLGAAGQQSVGADEVDLAGDALGEVEGLGDEAVAEEGSAPIAANST